MTSAASASVAAPASHAYVPDEATLAEIDRIFGALVTERKAPAYTYGIFDRGGLIASGHGGSATRVDRPGETLELNEHTRFRIASMSKSFAAAAVMQLAWQGKVDLHAPAADYVPQLANVVPWDRDSFPITVHDLLAMSCGLATDDAWADRQESISRAELQSLLAQRLRSIYSPGERYEYSNIGYAAIGEVIRNVSGMDVPDYVRTHLLEPLGLAETTYDWRDVPADKLCCGHHLDPGSEQNGDPAGATWVPETFADPGAFSVIGGVISSVHDVAEWDAWLARGFEPSPREGGSTDGSAGMRGDRKTDGAAEADLLGDEVLPRRYRRLMQMPHTPMPPVLRSGSSRGWLTRRDFNEIEAYGYGLIVKHDERFGDIAYHSGGYPGYGSNMRWHLDSGLGVVVLANGRYATPSVLAIRALSLLLEEASRPRTDGGRSSTPALPIAGWSFPLWPETRAAQERINAMLATLNGTEACTQAIASLADLLAMNVTLDATFDERGTQLAKLLAVTGLPVVGASVAGASATDASAADASATEPSAATGPSAGSVTVSNEHADSPAQLSWTVACEHHPLRCTIQLNSLEHPRVQTLEFARADAPRTDDIVTVTPTTRILR
ncbi:beta-lactamase family protein [Bifidobacterium amazonense]|uniref:Beta-lactamase family protein n=1 Tax=Bifidobacterium amazonense TaxID=2809027 RepID=A0ABS9VWS2_9BIFI|nr:serine hydrolase domain-containing protein [Bifidobacterium amazonense]MCH9276260.1 beta-lactamase family protein [Bifidobacterium amazonense]